MQNKVIEYYENYDEKGRLQRDNAHKIEYRTTIYYFDKLFKANSKVLDVCAGTGAYSFYLAGKGHHVTACDLVPHNVEIIRENINAGQLDDIQICNALDLSRFKDGSFDIVLCMGALYHLKDEHEKYMAVRECGRVLKSGGLLILSYINKFASIIMQVNGELTNMDEATAIYTKKSDSVFTFTTPNEVEEMAGHCNVTAIHNIGTDGMVYALGNRIKNASEQNFDKWLKYHISTCEEPSILGASLHGLYIGKKQ